MKYIILTSLAVTILVVFAVGNLVFAGPNGPNGPNGPQGELEYVCHYCPTCGEVELLLGPSGVDKHIPAHSMDYEGQCDGRND